MRINSTGDDNARARLFEAGLEPLGHRLAVGLARLSIVLRHHAWKHAHAREMTPTQGQALAFLRGQPGATLKEVASGLGVRPSTASDAVQSLESKGWVEKSRDPADGRRLCLALSRAGETEADRVSEWPDVLGPVIEDLPESEQAALMRVLQQMIRGLQGRGEIPVARVCLTCRFFQPHRHDDPAAPHHCGFVDRPFGESQLRLDCADHEPVEDGHADALAQRFIRGA